MIELKHTPGPWVVINGWDKNGNGKYFPSVVIKGDPKTENVNGRIVINISHDQEPVSLMANAKLIAAAPDLLSACLMAYYSLSQNEPPHVDVILKQLSDAIIKATE